MSRHFNSRGAFGAAGDTGGIISGNFVIPRLGRLQTIAETINNSAASLVFQSGREESFGRELSQLLVLHAKSVKMQILHEHHGDDAAREAATSAKAAFDAAMKSFLEMAKGT